MEKVDVTKIVQPGIEIFGILLMEPVTVITNLMISVMCFYAFWRMGKDQVMGSTLTYLKYYFLFMGLATTWGGFIGHGFLYLLDPRWKLVGWIISMIAVGLIERSAISYANRLVSERLGKFFLIANVIELVILMVLVISTVHFKFVEIHSAYGFIIVVCGFHLFVYLKTRDLGSLQMMWATISLLIAVYIFNKPVILHTFFNHRDLAHLFMLLGAWFQYQSYLKLGQRASEAATSS
ncbi:MAG: hypothetical protein AAGA85_09195 [Bacteroidota bacterium]